MSEKRLGHVQEIVLRSLTIDGIYFVVDPGMSKVKMCPSWANYYWAIEGNNKAIIRLYKAIIRLYKVIIRLYKAILRALKAIIRLYRAIISLYKAIIQGL